MGLASKLAATQGAAVAYPGANTAYPPPPPPPQRQQQGPNSYRPQIPGNAGPQQQGAYPPPQQQYGVPPQQSGGSNEVASYRAMLEKHIQDKGLQNFYFPNSPDISRIANRAPQQIDRLCQQWKIHKEIGADVCKLALYDIILYLDDSGSMEMGGDGDERGERIKDLELIVNRVAFAATLFDDDGIDVRFMNTNLPQGLGDGIKSEAQVAELIHNVRFSGLTPLGTNLRQKVLQPKIIGPAQMRQLKKPVLVITVTDGQPAGEPSNAIFEAIRWANSEINRTGLGHGSLAFQFAQVGNDLKARQFLGKLDTDPGVGDLVDCTSNYESEADEMSRQNPPVSLTPDLWLVKLLLGAIDPSYDSKDEERSWRPQGQDYPQRPPQAPQNYGPPGNQQQNYGPPGNQQSNYGQPNYGQPPPGPPGYGGPGNLQQNYGQPNYGQQAYGQPPYGQQSYPPPPNQPPNQQGGYRPPQGGPPNYPNQQGYQPPQQAPYNPQAGGYGRPPPPPPRY